MFFCEFCKLFTKIFWQKHLRMTASCVYLWILRSCSDHVFYRVPLGNFLFQVQVAAFQPPDTGKKYFTSGFQTFYTRTISSYSKARSSHLRCCIKKDVLRITSSEEALKMREHNLFQEMKRKVVLLVIYLFNYDSFKSTLFIYGIWRSLEYSFCQINENSSFLAILRDYKKILLFALCFEICFFIKA